MELSSNLLTPATLFLGKMPTKDNEWGLGGPPSQCGEEINFLRLAGNQAMTHSHISG